MARGDDFEAEYERRRQDHEQRRLAAAEKVTEKTASQVFAESVRIQRKRKGWTLQQLAARLTEIGYPVHWTTVSKLEKAGTPAGRNPKLEDLVAYSIALDVAPVHLLAGSYLPWGTALKLTPSVAGLHPRLTRGWVRGEAPLPEQDHRRYHSEVAPEEFYPPGVRFLDYRYKMLDLGARLTHAARSADPLTVKEVIRQINEVEVPS